MSLLQINEPHIRADKPANRYAIGIDLGTTNSLVATVVEGQPIVLQGEQDEGVLPSVVHYAKETITVGAAAREKAIKDPLNTMISIKRLMGRSAHDIAKLSGQLPYHFQHEDNGLPKIETIQGIKTPVEVSADILKTLKQRAETLNGQMIEGVVITVPAYFDDAQRQATKDAAKLAGLPVLRLLNEPTAAAVAYGLDSGAEGLHVIYDLGGGTFDVSVLRLNKGVFEVIGTGGDSALGGDDIDLAVAEWVLAETDDQKVLNFSQHRELLTLARSLKESLTMQEAVTFQWCQRELNLTQVMFEQLALPVIEKTLNLTMETLKACGVTFDEVKDVVLVGGVTRIPCLRKKVENLFHQPPLGHIDPDKVVALGAAIQADILSGNRKNEDLLLLDVLPLSLSLETMGGLTEKIIPRNHPIPAVKAQQFTTYQDGQTGMKIHVVQGERELVKDCRSLAEFELTSIPPMKAGLARIEVTFQVDADGLLNVTAKEMQTGIHAQIQVKPSYGLTDEEVTQLLQNAYAHAKEDKVHRELKEVEVEATHLLNALDAALKEDGDQYLSDNEKTNIAEKIKLLKKVLGKSERKLIQEALTALEAETQTFAERRMEGHVRSALKGKTVEDVLHDKN